VLFIKKLLPANNRWYASGNHTAGVVERSNH